MGQKGGCQRDPRGAEEQREGKQPGREALLQTRGVREGKGRVVDENLGERWNLLHRELLQSCDSHPLLPMEEEHYTIRGAAGME